MGVLTEIAKRKGLVIEKPKKKNSKFPKPYQDFPILTAKIDGVDIDLLSTLASYIISFEILTTIYFNEDDEFPKVYDKFRKDWNIEKYLSKVVNYDVLVPQLYKEVQRWIEQGEQQK